MEEKYCSGKTYHILHNAKYFYFVLFQTVYLAGMLVGSFPIGILSDKFGRRPLLMVTLLFLAVGGSLPYFFPADPSYYPFFVFARFISGIGHVGTFMMSFTLSLEYVGPKYRTHFGILIETPFALGNVYFSEGLT